MKVGDMEIQNANSSGIGSQFKTIDEVQNMIRHLQILEEHMISANGARGFSASFEDLSLVDVDDFQIDENETEWLTKVPGAKKISAKDLVESDESYIDSGLLNVRYGLLNLIKSSKIEEKASLLANSPRCTKALSTVGTHDIRRKSPVMGSIFTVPQRATSPVPFKRSFEHTSHSPSRAFTLLKLENESSPPAATSIKSPYEFLSPGYQPPLSLFEKPTRDINQLFVSTPAGKNPIDSRTYTRPKKHRIPLDTYNDQLDLQVSPIKFSQNHTNPVHHHHHHHQQEDIMELNNPTAESEAGLIGSNPRTNMNETFVAAEFDDDDEDEDPGRNSEGNKQPRRVTRNLSYVIRRDSESSNNNSPPVPSSGHDGGLENVEHLNNTFVRGSREDTYSPSPTGSSNSIHNTSSMEELHNLARQQEQSLRMTSNPRMLTRKETHTVVRVPHDSQMQQPILRHTNTDIGGGAQQKLRIQSRIPAPGAGSRIGSIRPPAINGTATTTRGPMTRGGAY